MLSALEVRGVWSISVVLFGWPAMVRLQHASVLEASAREYVTAAHALGASSLRVPVRHVVPKAVRPLLAHAASFAGLVIGIEGTLTFIGVGLQQPALSWGLLVSRAQTRLAQTPHLVVPAVLLVVCAASRVLLAPRSAPDDRPAGGVRAERGLGDALRDLERRGPDSEKLQSRVPTASRSRHVVAMVAA